MRKAFAVVALAGIVFMTGCSVRVRVGANLGADLQHQAPAQKK